MSQLFSSKTFITLLIGFSFNSLFAFGVDVCFKDKQGKRILRNCIDIPNRCRTEHLDKKDKADCQKKALSDSLKGLIGYNQIVGARSLIHSDATYFLAQVIGYTPWQAYQIMIYNEATDQSAYTPFNQQGKALLSSSLLSDCRKHWGPNMPPACLLATPNIQGVSKFNFKTGGTFLHLHARYSPTGKPLPPISYPTHYLDDPVHEVVLSNFKTWLYNQRWDACVGGITTDHMALKSPCESSRFRWRNHVSLSKIEIPIWTTLGTLVIQPLKIKLIVARNQYLKKYLFPHDSDFAKLGIFLHTLQDRYSHHLCVDHSYFYRQPDGQYRSIYHPNYCSQSNHFLWHAWEAGTLQTDANLNPIYQTMRPALENTFDQLMSYATYHHILINKSLNKQQLIDELIQVLQITSPDERLKQMVLLMAQYHLLPLPGHGQHATEPLEAWLKQSGWPDGTPRQY